MANGGTETALCVARAQIRQRSSTTHDSPSTATACRHRQTGATPFQLFARQACRSGVGMAR